MKIEFKKITHEPKEFSLSLNECSLQGRVWKVEKSLFCIDAHLSGSIELICDLSGEEYVQELDEKLNIKVSDGIYAPKPEDEEFDVIEFFHGVLDLEELLRGELESIRLSYHSRGDSLE